MLICIRKIVEKVFFFHYITRLQRKQSFLYKYNKKKLFLGNSGSWEKSVLVSRELVFQMPNKGGQRAFHFSKFLI